MRHTVRVAAGPAPSDHPQPVLRCRCGWSRYVPNGWTARQVAACADRHAPRPKPPVTLPAPPSWWQRILQKAAAS